MNNPHRGGRWAAFVLCLTFALPLLARGQDEEDMTLRLTLGDPKLKDKSMAVVTGGILAGRSGKPVPFPRMIKDLSRARFVYVGESHDDLAMHDIQLRVIEALHAEVARHRRRARDARPSKSSPSSTAGAGETSAGTISCASRAGTSTGA